MKVIDQNTWDRKEIFDLFSAADYPFYSITIPVDVTKVKEVSKNKGISFYYLIVKYNWNISSFIYYFCCFSCSL